MNPFGKKFSPPKWFLTLRLFEKCFVCLILVGAIPVLAAGLAETIVFLNPPLNSNLVVQGIQGFALILGYYFLVLPPLLIILSLVRVVVLIPNSLKNRKPSAGVTFHLVFLIAVLMFIVFATFVRH